MQADRKAWDGFYDLVKRKTGIDFHLYKESQLQRRTLSMAASRNMPSLDAFAEWVGASPENLEWFLDKMAINVSELFRNPERWEVLEKEVLPELLTRSRTLKCWSAGCSYGAEAHTLGAVLHRSFPGGHSVLGTDIDTAALNQARASDFCEADMRGVPSAYRPYFVRDGARWTVVPEVKKYLKFEKQNLLADRFGHEFDLILCRNVVIYFTDEAKDVLYERFVAALKPGGYLFVGSTERISRARELRLESTHSFFYRKPMLGDSQWQNAS